MIQPRYDFDRNPYMVIWEITRACALACRHCRAEAQCQAHPDELKLSEALNLIDQIDRAHPDLLIFTGGDPMRRNDLFELLQYAGTKSFRVALSPSATPHLINTDFQQIHNRGVSRISLSLDGVNAQAHNNFRGVRKTWDWTMQAVNKAHDAGLSIQINTTMTRQNIDDLDLFLPVLDLIRPATWSVFMLVPTGRGKREDMISAREVESLFQRLHAISRTVPYMIKTTEGQHYRRVCLQQEGKGPADYRSPVPGINDGKGFVFVSHTGEICPSGFFPYVAGNVKTDELIDVYRNNPLFRDLRSPQNLKGKCGRCPYNNICGGSRARAYAVTGDYMASEPLCIYQPDKDLLSC